MSNHSDILKDVRRFPIEQRKEEKLLTEHIVASKIILFAGYQHCHNVANYLQSQGGTVTNYNALPNKKRCVPIPHNIIY